MDYKNANVLVTGASGGIGKGLAEEFAKLGANLILVARSEGKLIEIANQLSSQYGVQADVFAADLSLTEAPKQVIDWLISKKLNVDVLVNNAGFGMFGMLHEADAERTHQQLMLNIVSLTDLTRELLPGMVERAQGTVINIASTAAFQPVPRMAVYAATKAYVLSFTEALWGEYRGTGVNFLAVCPGATATEFLSTAGEDAAFGPMRTVEQVVKTTFKALEDGRPSAVDGVGGRLITKLARVTPRSTTVKVTAAVMGLNNKLKK